MEKRLCQRKPANLQAVLSDSTGWKCPVRICDFSQGGLLLELTAAPQRGNQPDLPASQRQWRVFLQNQKLSLPVEIVRQDSRRLGMRFVAVNPRQLDHLASAVRSANDAMVSRTSATAANAALFKLNRLFSQFVDRHLDHALQQAQASMLESARLQPEARQQQALLDAAMRLSRERHALRRQTLGALADGVAVSGSRPVALGASHDPASSQTSIPANQNINNWPLVRMAISRSELHCSDSLQNLQARLNGAWPGRFALNPFSPTAICHALNQALLPLQLPQAAIKVIYDSLQNQLLGVLEPLYQRINHQLASDGVHPLPTKPKPSSAPVTPAASGKPAGRPDSDPPPAAADPLELLQNLQGKPAAMAELVEGVFSDMAGNQRMPEDMQTQLRQLQAPVLRHLLEDGQALQRNDHPLRQTLDNLALLTDCNNANSDQHRKAISEVIRDILGNLDGKADFASVNQALEGLVQREQRLIKHNLKRIRETCEGQQRLQQANRAIETSLQSLLPRPVPQPLLELLEHGWKSLMRLTWLRVGRDSREWRMTLAVVAQLAQPSAPRIGKQAALAPDQLLRLVAGGLAKIPDELGRRGQLLKDLGLLLREPDSFPRASYQSSNADKTAMEARLKALQAAGSNLQRWLQRAERLQPGDWLEISDGHWEDQRVQVVWRAEDGSRLVFANRRASRSLTLELEEVALMLRDGRLSHTTDPTLSPLEQGLESLVQKVYERLAYDANHDSLTGLMTRRAFLRHTAEVVSNCGLSTREHCLIFINLLQFKLLNSTLGYAAGDRLLRQVARQIHEHLPEQGWAGRIGADQFALLVPLPLHNQGLQLARSLKRQLESLRFEHADQQHVIASSMAILGFADDSHSAAELLRHLENAVNMGRDSGRTQVQVVQAGDRQLQALDQVMHWVARINRALDDDQLQLVCQRIQPLRGNHLPHFEILLRVIDEQGKALSPAEFIKVAESCHRMAAVDRWVIEHTLSWMHANAQILAQFGGFSINLSGHSLNDEGFMDFLFATLSRYPVPREKLIFEITETTAVSNLEEAADLIAELRSIGCRFSLDDFGAGQSSFNYLKRLPVDYLKIDGAFIRDITSNPVDRAMARSITDIGHHLGKRVIAEFVGNSQTLRAIRELGIDYAQGHFYGLPVPLEQLAENLGKPDVQP